MVFGKRKNRTTVVLIVTIVVIGGIIFIGDDTLISKQRGMRCDKRIFPLKTRFEINENENLLSKSLFDMRSLLTSVRCVGPLYNQSCLYRNLYYNKGIFWAISLKEDNLTLPGVRLEALATTDYRPQHRIFDKYEEVFEYVHSTIDPMVLPGLTVHFNQRWHRNIGHALFDGLYPAYVSLIRFAPKHIEPFRVFVGLDQSECESCFSEDVYSRFGGIGLIKSNIIDSEMPNRWFVFEELLMGSGMMCQRCIQSNYQLPGGIELDGSRLFRDRIYKQHGIIPPPIRQYSNQRRHPRQILQAYIIHNKRFTEEEQQQLKEAAAEINQYTNEHMNKSIEQIQNLSIPLVHVIYFDYRNLTNKQNFSSKFRVTPSDSRSALYELIDHKFISQLRILRQMDIHITGPGTGQMYQTFLSDGSVNINLGGMNPYQKETTPIAYPSFLEQYVTAGTPYIKGLYYPINKRRDGIKKREVIQLIHQAAQMIIQGFSIPVNPKENLAPDGKVFVEQCKYDQQFCHLVTIRKPGQFWCNNMWTEDLVHERRQWAEGGFIIGGTNTTCPFNRTLLRNLREKYQIEYRPGRE